MLLTLANVVIFGSDSLGARDRILDLRLPFSSPPTTRRVTVEVFDPAPTRDCLVCEVKVKVILRLTVSQSVGPGVVPYVGLMRYLLQFDSCGFVFVGHPL
jgi:hypothetical protein